MKIIITLCLLGLLVLAGYGQSQRYVVFEEFTNASCGPCASQNPGFQALMAANTSKCAYITYHWNFPGVNDPMYLANPADMETRIGYYGFNFVPSCVMDGVTIPSCSGGYAGAPACITQSMINTEYAVPSPFQLTISQQLSPNNDSIYVTVQGLCTEAVSGSLVCHLVVVEKHIHYNNAPGNNGEKDFYNVMRKMLPSADGTPLASSFQPGGYFVYREAWKLSNITTLSELNVIGFVQNNMSKAVQQAAIAIATPITGLYANDVEITGLGSLLPEYCVNNIAPVVHFRNTGSEPVTSINFHYKVNSGDVADYPWTGNLNFLDEATIQLPAYTFGLENSNLLTVYADGINGVNDDYPRNDTIRTSFEAAKQTGEEVFLSIKTDNYPEETTWNITDVAGNTLTSGGPYNENLHTYTYTIPVAFGTCYQFNIYDSGGNGICCGTSGLGRYQLKSGSGIIKGGAAFGSEDHVQFYSGAGVGIPEAAYPFAFSIYPNPTTSMATLTIENSAPANLEVRVLNMQGSELQRIPAKAYDAGSHEILLDCSDLPAGLYTVQLNTGDKTYSRKLAVSR